MPEAVNDCVIELGEWQKVVLRLQFHSWNRILEEETDPHDINIAGVHDCKDDESDNDDLVKNDTTDEGDHENPNKETDIFEIENNNSEKMGETNDDKVDGIE